MKKHVLPILVFFTASLFLAAEEHFRAGVYIYDYQFSRAAKSHGEELNTFVDRHFAILKKNRIDLVHLSVSDRGNFESIFLPALKKHGIKALLQLDFAYFRNRCTDAELEKMAAKAAAFMKKYKSDPTVIAFSVKEEILPGEVGRLADYQKMIRSREKDAPFFLTHCDLKSVRCAELPRQSICGTDRYAFWWDGFRASPAYSLRWLRGQAELFSTAAASRGDGDFLWVITQGGFLHAYTEDELAKRFPGKKGELIRSYAEKRLMGWFRDDTVFMCWKYYRLPQNCLKGAVWSGVLEGAKYVLIWSYAPPAKEEEMLSPSELMHARMRRRNSRRGSAAFFTMADRPGYENGQMKEFSETIAEIKKFDFCLGRMIKVERNPIVFEKNANAFSRAYSFPGIAGRIVIVHNADVGKWPCGSRFFFKQNDPIRIDDKGDFAEYIPHAAPRKIPFRAKCSRDENVFDLASGKCLSEPAVEIAPGSGTLLFVGTESEFRKLTALK